MMNSEKRMEWDEYFISIALLASRRSPCTRLHVGSVIVRDNRLISMGYCGMSACLSYSRRTRASYYSQ